MIRAVLLENMPNIGISEGVPENSFPYAPENAKEPQQVDPLTHYFMDWEKFSENDSVFEFPKQEFELGMSIERQKDPKSQILDVANKVIEMLKQDAQFYTKLKERMT